MAPGTADHSTHAGSVARTVGGVRHPLLLLPRPIDQFLLSEHAHDLVARGDGAVALPGRVPYGAIVRAPRPLQGVAAGGVARSIARQIPSSWPPAQTVLVAYHAIEWPVAERLLRRGVADALWYFRWDQYEAAHDLGPRHQLLAGWHEAMAARAELIFTVSDELTRFEHDAGRKGAITVGQSCDAFPDGPLSPGGRGAELVAAARAAGAGSDAGAHTATSAAGAQAAAGPVAVSLGHLGRRTDWAWLRAAAEQVPDLELLLIGGWYDDEAGDDPDYQWLRRSPQAVWLGRLDDADAAAVIAQADVGLIPFTVDPFNSAGLPMRILKYARLGRRTIAPPLAGSRTWAEVVDFVDDAPAFAAALRAAAGRRAHIDPADPVRTWALEQTVGKMNDPLLERLGR